MQPDDEMVGKSYFNYTYSPTKNIYELRPGYAEHYAIRAWDLYFAYLKTLDADQLVGCSDGGHGF